MQCQICGRETHGDICKKCLKAIKMDDRLKDMSNEYYNRGLKKAQVRDITGALKDLEKSIAYDKNNYYARNLAGLCYREIGMYGEASKNWFLSRYNEFPDNKVQDYIDEIGVELSQNKGLVKSIELYNEALVKIGNKELADTYTLLVEATEMNVNFVPALNLLILVHLIQRQYDRAIPLIDRVLAIDVKNEKALHYYSLATKNKFRPSQLANNRLPQSETEVRTVKVLDKKMLGISVVSAVVITLAVSFGAFNFMGQNNDEYDALSAKYQEALNASKTTADEYAKNIAQKDTEINTLNTEKAELESQIEGFNSIENLITAKNLYDEQKYVESAAKLYVVDLAFLDVEQKALYDRISNDAYTRAIKLLKSSGIEKYNASEFADSKSELQNAYLYCEKVEVPEREIAEIIYYLGMSNEALGEKTQAKEYYNILLEKYPDYAKDSEERIATLS